MSDPSSVQVALRIRSPVASDSINALQVLPESNEAKLVNSDKTFTYDHIFDFKTQQYSFCSTCIKPLIEDLFKGYNITIFAYGQTSSGKTHSMGTDFSGQGEMGVIPFAIHDIFCFIRDSFSWDFKVTISYMELCQDKVHDLLQPHKSQDLLEIEDEGNGVIIPGLIEHEVKFASEAFKHLKEGAKRRAVGVKSHAIFTVNINIQNKNNSMLNKTAKLLLIDLAGTWSLNDTDATKKGLLALDNLILELADKHHGSVPYKDSTLTKLLQDSLGGNSITLMIACVNPSSAKESEATMRCAEHVRQIKNKPVINMDAKQAEINKLNKLVNQLRLELAGRGGSIICQAELDLLKKDSENFKLEKQELTAKLSVSLKKQAFLEETLQHMQSTNKGISQGLDVVAEDCRNNFPESTKMFLKLKQLQRDLKLANEEMRIYNVRVSEAETSESRISNGVHKIDLKKRKVEEAFSMNKRLNDLALQKTMQDAGEINKWIEQQFSEVVSITDAKWMLQDFETDKATLEQELHCMKANADYCPQEIVRIKDNIELRALQIKNLKQSLKNLNENLERETKWNNLQSIAETEQILKLVFERIAEERKLQCAKNFERKELQATLSVYTRETDDLEEALRKQKLLHKNELVNVEQKYRQQQEVIDNLEKNNKECKETITRLERAIKKNEKFENTVLKERPVKNKADALLATSKSLKTEPALKNATASHIPIGKSMQGGCNCKKSCASRICSCKKRGVSCTSTCKCSLPACLNREQTKENAEETTGMDEAVAKTPPKRVRRQRR